MEKKEIEVRRCTEDIRPTVYHPHIIGGGLCLAHELRRNYFFDNLVAAQKMRLKLYAAACELGFQDIHNRQRRLDIASHDREGAPL